MAVGAVLVATGLASCPTPRRATKLPASPPALAVAASRSSLAGTALGDAWLAGAPAIGAATATVVVTAVTAFVVGPAVAATNVPPTEIAATPTSRRLTYESVRLTTEDGVHLAGWYLASTNDAAVVLLHGAGSTRSDVLDEAAVLARHGFGVLLLDARGHGESGGRAMDFGWHGDADIAAATRYLAGRPDVDRERIGVVGMSMGGEEALGASATDGLIRPSSPRGRPPAAPPTRRGCRTGSACAGCCRSSSNGSRTS